MAYVYNFLRQLVITYFNSIILFLGLFIGTFLIVKVLEKIILIRIKKLAKQTSNKIDNLLIEIIESIKLPFYIIFAVFVASRFVDLYKKLDLYLYYFFLITLVYYLAKAIQAIINFWANNLKEKAKKDRKSLDPSAINLIRKIFIGLTWGVALIILLQNFGYNLSTLVAGLGVGGVAIAFALQNILGDFFAAFSIYFDKPFETGDYITVGDEGGTVEKIGIKSTRIKTLRGEELIVSNKNLTDMKIHNFKKMKKRRITFSIGVTYDTSTKKLRKAKEIIKDVLVKVKKIELDQVNFVNFGDFSLDFEIAYYVQSKEFTFYKKKQEEINLKIKEEFEKEGIEMAYPTQTILINKKS